LKCQVDIVTQWIYKLWQVGYHQTYLNYIIGTNKYHFGDFLIFFDLEDKEETGEAGMSLEILLDTTSMPARTSEYLAESFPFTLSYIFKAIL